MSGFNVQMTRGALLHGRKSVCGHIYDGGGLKVQALMEKPAWAAARNLHEQNTVARCKHLAALSWGPSMVFVVAQFWANRILCL